MAMEKFHFTSTDGEVDITVPFFMDAMTRKGQKKLMQLAKEAGGFENVDEDEMFKLAGLSKETIAKIDELNLREYTRFLKEWQEQSKLGES